MKKLLLLLLFFPLILSMAQKDWDGLNLDEQNLVVQEAAEMFFFQNDTCQVADLHVGGDENEITFTFTCHIEPTNL